MRLLHFTAGAAGMYCGSCLRDNALAAALRSRGHDVVLTPLYTPTNPDGANASSTRVYFGGISVYLQQHLALFRHTPALIDRLWDSAAALRVASKRQIKIAPADLGDMTVSMLLGARGFQAKEMTKLLRWLRTEPPFDSLTLPNSLLIGLAQPLREALGIPIVCVLQGEDLFLEGLTGSWRSQAVTLIQQQIDQVDVFLAVSDFYREFMTNYLRIPASKICTLRLGIELDGVAVRPTKASPPYTIGYFGRIAPEKGLHLLAEAYRRLRARAGVPPTRLVAGGYLLDEHRPYLADITRKLAEWGLADHFEYAGAPDRAGKRALMAAMDVFSMPATCDEPKGMAVLEAAACGVPVVQPHRGAFSEIIARTGAGLLVAPDDPDALAEGLSMLLTDRARAAKMGQAGAAGVREHYSVDRTAAEAERIYEKLGTRH